jgi:hypothetical protein
VAACSCGFCGKGAERTRVASPKAAFAEHWNERVRSAGVDSKSSDEGLRWRRYACVRMVTKGNFRRFACDPVRARPAQTGELVIVRDHSGRDDSGAVQMDRGDRQNRDRKSKHEGYYPGRKTRSTPIYSMVYSNKGQSERPVKSFE